MNKLSKNNIIKTILHKGGLRHFELHLTRIVDFDRQSVTYLASHMDASPQLKTKNFYKLEQNAPMQLLPTKELRKQLKLNSFISREEPVGDGVWITVFDYDAMLSIEIFADYKGITMEVVQIYTMHSKAIERIKSLNPNATHKPPAK